MLPLYPSASLLAVSRLSAKFRPASWPIGKRRQAAALQNNGTSLPSKTYGHHHPSQLLACKAFEVTSRPRPRRSRTSQTTFTACPVRLRGEGKPFLRRSTLIAGSIVDAAHIHEFRDSRNNDPRNGIALSRSAHWTFDQGLWTIAAGYRITVAVGHLAEAGPNEDNLLASYH